MSNLLERASIVLTPTGFNNGEALCVKPSDGSGDFDFSRNSAATRVNSQGLVEVVANNLPRINYEGGCGHWLFEPQSTNLITQSELFSDASWDANSDVIIDKGYLAPDGTNNASKVTVDGTNPKVAIFLTGTKPLTKSIYARTVSGTGTIYLGEGSLSGSLVNVTDQWQRFEITNYNNNFYGADFRGSSTLTEVIIWGAQLESQSYATSYIPSNGTSVTRNQDVCTNGGSLASINSTEGVLYAEIARNNGDTGITSISLNDGIISDVVSFYYLSTNQVYLQIRSSLPIISQGVAISDTYDFNKIALKYKSNDISLWINGVEVSTSTSAISLSGLNNLNFSYGNGSIPFFGKTKAVAVFKEALSDEELTELTTI